MKLDPWTLAFQVLNFAVLLFILFRLLFKPIREIMERRKAQVEESLNAAENARREAEALKAGLVEETQRADRLKVEAMERMKGEVGEARQRLLEAAAKDAQAVREKAEALLGSERRTFEGRVKEEAVRAVSTYAARLVREIADPLLHEGLLRRLPRELGRMADDLAALPGPGGAVNVRIESAYPLSAEEAARLGALLGERLALAELTTVIETDLIAGIRLHARDRVYDFSLRGQLEALAARLKETV